MKYLLFVYPCDENWDEVTSNQTIATELSCITKSDEIKFVFGENHSIFHFETAMSQPELTIYVELILEESPKFMFVLSQTTKNITSNMDKGHLKDFLSINKRGRKSKKENPIQDFFVKNIEEQYIENYVEQDELIKRQEQILQDYINYHETSLSIDEILDKIHQNGLNSLTKAERKKLDDHSKEK